MIIWAGLSVTLMVAGTDTTGCYMGIEMETTLSLEPWEASLNELSLRAPSLPETQPQGAPPQSTQLQLTRPLQGRKEIQSNRNDNALSQGSHEQCVRLSTEGGVIETLEQFSLYCKRNRLKFIQ